MSDVKRLLDEATPLPWSARTATRAKGHWDALVVLHAVNRLPDYEAAVEALERFVESHEAGYPASLIMATEACDAARAALARLREAVPA